MLTVSPRVQKSQLNNNSIVCKLFLETTIQLVRGKQVGTTKLTASKGKYAIIEFVESLDKAKIFYK
jgi:hypothetical protein